MVGPQMRPRFSLSLDSPAASITAAFAARLDTRDGLPGAVRGQHVEIKIHPRDQHFWSPQLNLEVLPSDAGGATVHGLYSPRPDVWTMFVALHAVSVFAIFVGATFGFSQWTLGQPPWALWGIPAGVVASTLLYAASLAGQKISQEQMAQLRDFMEQTFPGPWEEVG